MAAVPGGGHSEPKGSFSFALLGLVEVEVGWWGKVEAGGGSGDSLGDTAGKIFYLAKGLPL